MSAEEGLPVDLAPDDLASLPELNDDAVLNGIRTRFEQKKIHTQINNLLVVLNPYQRLPIYSEGLMVEYKAATEGSMPPHVFGTAASSYTGLLAQRSQSIVISGESGAGKSETAKKVLQHLAFAASASKSTGEGDIGIEARILASSPLLEAFGNAKTVMNNNSSRCARAREGRGRGPRGAGRGARGERRGERGGGTRDAACACFPPPTARLPVPQGSMVRALHAMAYSLALGPVSPPRRLFALPRARAPAPQVRQVPYAPVQPRWPAGMRHDPDLPT